MKSEAQQLADAALYEIHREDAKRHRPIAPFVPDQPQPSYLAQDGSVTTFDEPPRTIED